MEYELIRSSRRTLSIEVSRDGRVLVRAPRNCSKKQIEEFLARKAKWIAKKLDMQKRIAEQVERQTQLTEQQTKFYREKAREVLTQRVEHYAKAMGVTYGRIAIREQRTRWGSCSEPGNLNFNWKLILMPPGVLDYVVVHELAHRREMNHSDRFWAVVEYYMPEYKKYREWLKENGRLF